MSESLGDFVNKTIQGVGAFADEMREKGVHVGIKPNGDQVECITCGQPWPCPTSRAEVAAYHDPAHDAALAHAHQIECCGNGTWRGRLCEYHQGYEDGFDAARGTS